MSWWLRSANASCSSRRDAVDAGELLGARAQRDRPLLGHLRVDHAPAERRRVQRLRRPSRSPSRASSSTPGARLHRLGAADEQARRVAGLDDPAGLHRGVQRRAAQAVDGRAGTLVGSPASSTAIRATLRLSSPAWLASPKMHLVDPLDVQVRMACEQRAHDVRRQIIRAHARQPAAVAAEGRARRRRRDRRQLTARSAPAMRRAPRRSARAPVRRSSATRSSQPVASRAYRR